MSELKVGQTAPRFSLKDKDGKPHSLSEAKADYTVLYFYPKDDTPGCTLEAKEFSELLPKFKSRNVRVVGISGGNEKSKTTFCKKHALKVPLLSDTNFKVAKSYGAYGAKKFMGRSFKGIFRKTYLVDSSGKIAKVFPTVKPEGHAEEVLAAIEELETKSSKARPVKRVAPKKSKKAAPKRAAKSTKRGAVATKKTSKASSKSRPRVARATKSVSAPRRSAASTRGRRVKK